MSARSCPSALLAALLALPLGAVAQQLESGTEVGFELPGRALAQEIYIDVPDDAGALKVELDSLTADRDLDLVLRALTPFRVGSTPDPQALFDQAHYRSASAGSDEFVTITRSGHVPVQPGRWHIGVLNFSNQPAQVRLKATVLDEPPVVPIQMVYDMAGENCDVAPWSGERRAAMDRAAALLTEQLRPRAPVRVRACWRSDLGEGTLAQAGPLLVGSDFSLSFLPQLRDRYTIMATAAAAQQAGTSLCRFAGGPCSDTDVQAFFNAKASFYYGLDRNTPPGQANFISTAMHEIAHGLGFLGLLAVPEGGTYTGAPVLVNGRAYRDAYGAHTRWHKLGEPAPLPFLGLSDADRAAAVVSENQLRFHGPNLRSILGVELRLYAPRVFNQGSTYSHFDTMVLGNELMAHRISANSPHDLGLALGVLYDVGWDPDPEPRALPPVPPGGQYYDPGRSGHGIALYRVAGTEDFYFLVFYTYDAAGLPEFYVANGHVQEGVFAPERSANGDSLVRSLYRFGSTPPGYPDADPAFNGQIRMDFNQPGLSPVCAGRDQAAAVLTFTLPGSANQQWCLQSLADSSSAANDLTNIWLNYADTGWGASSLSFGTGDGDGLGMQVYYPDANGEPRWAIMQTGDYTPGASYPLLQPRGYCRTCPSTQVEFEQVGNITVGLDSDAAGSTGRLQFDVSFDGPAGGNFKRDTEVVPGGEADG